MKSFLKNNRPLISFFLIPVVFLWHPNWLGFLGIQPYWPLFWLLPWSMIYGSMNGLIAGLCLGLILDALTLSNNFTQIPGLILCGIWFGRVKKSDNYWVGHFRYGLIGAIGSFLCGLLYFLQIFIHDFLNNNFFVIYPSIKVILAQVFLTAIFAPLFCSYLLKSFKFQKNKNTIKIF